MRVTILQGKQTGHIQDVDPIEGENLIATGFAELAPPIADPVPDAEGGSLVDEDGDDAISEKSDPDDAVPARVRRRTAKPKATSPASRRKRR